MVKSMSRLGIGLSVVFGCFFLALVAELYYVFWWRKKRRGSRASTTSSRSVEGQYTSSSRELLYLLCWKRRKCLHNNQQEPLRRGEAGVGDATISNDDLERADRAPFMAKFFPDGIMDSEILDLHSLLGPPRVLFTIKEETKEDMDSEDGRSRKSRRGTRSRSFSSDVLIANITSERVSCGGSPMDSNTPFVTPPTSPPFCTPMATPPLTPLHATLFPSKPYPQRLSPLSDTSRFSSSTTSANSSFPSSFSSSLSHSPFLSPPSSALLHITTQSKPSKENLETNNHSPPPKFKFLRDAEEKAKKAAKCTNNAMLTKKNEGMGNKNQQGDGGSSSSASSSPMSSDEDGSFITIIVGESNNSLVPHPSSPITTPNHIHVVPTSSLMFGTTNGVKKDRHY